MVEPIKHDSLSEVSTVGSRALTGALIGLIAPAVVVAGIAAFGFGLSAGLSLVIGAAAGITFGSVSGAVGMIGGAFGALSGIEKTSQENSAYQAKMRHQELARQNISGKAKDAGFQEGVMVGYQQASQDLQGQAQMIYQQGMQDGAQHVVQHLQEQQKQMTAAPEESKKSHAEKLGCAPCASHAQAVEESKAAAAAAQHGVV